MVALPDPKFLVDLDPAEILVREPAVGPHPRTHVMTEFSSAEKILLVSGAEVFACRECGWYREQLVSVISHQNAHAIKRRRRGVYDDSVVRAVIQEVRRAKRARGANYVQRAVAALNEKNITPLRGDSWTVDIVSRVYNRYADSYPPAGRPMGSKSVEPVSPAPVRTGRRRPNSLSLLAEVSSAVVLAKNLLTSLAELAVRVEADEWVDRRDAVSVVDPEILAKAKQWDHIKSMLKS